MVYKAQELYPAATKEWVSRKINMLRSSFRRELRKVYESRKTASTEDDVYHPSLWYFNLFLFLAENDPDYNDSHSIEESQIIDPKQVRHDFPALISI